MNVHPATEPLTPVYTAALFAPLHDELIRLLRSFDHSDWERPTVAGAWRVKDVVAHILDGDLRRLSGDRDRYQASGDPANAPPDLVTLIDTLNRTGVGYARRLSPRVLVDLLAVTGLWVADHFERLNPHADAVWAVSWAGESRSQNWMDTGRDYTERWHHQVQIRDVRDDRALLASRWLEPALELSVRAFPVAYDDVMAEPGTAVVFEVEGDRTYAWTIMRASSGWTVVRGRADAPAAIARVTADTAWRILYNALPPDRARARVVIEGDARLIDPLLRARSIVTER